MEIPHVDIVKRSIGGKAIDALREIFKCRKDEPPSVPIQRFRADNEFLIEALDILEGKYSLIERTNDCNNYLIRPYALPLICTSESDKILNIMERIYEKLPMLYKEHLTQPIGIDLLCDSITEPKELINEALYYLSASHGIHSGITIGFPYAPNSTLCISETVLSKKSIGQVLSEYFEWNFVNPSYQVASLENFHDWDDDINSVFFSKKCTSGKPDWYELLDDTQKALILEIDNAISNNLEALPTIGLRTLLETIMVEKIGDSGGFNKKVESFTNAGYVTQKMAEALSHVLDAGNASAHRAYFPSREDLVTCVDLVKHLIHGIYILRPQVEKIANNTPKRDNT